MLALDLTQQSQLIQIVLNGLNSSLLDELTLNETVSYADEVILNILSSTTIYAAKSVNFFLTYSSDIEFELPNHSSPVAHIIDDTMRLDDHAQSVNLPEILRYSSIVLNKYCITPKSADLSRNQNIILLSTKLLSSILNKVSALR
jgi:hypothetical protein